MTMKPILIDADEVIVDFNGEVLRMAREQAGIFVRYEDIREWSLERAIGWPGLDAAVTHAVKHADLCARLKPIPEGLAWLRAVEQEFGVDRVFVCTAPWPRAPEWLAQRAWWLNHHGVPIERQIHARAKHLIPGHLVDDAPHHVSRRPWNQGFLLARPWNTALPDNPRGDYAAAMAWLRDVAK